MNEHLGLVAQGERRRGMYPQHLRVVPSYFVATAAAPMPAITLDMLRTTGDVLAVKRRQPPPVVPDRSPSAPNVMQKFCSVYEELSGRAYSLTDLRSVRRSAPIAKPRHVCILLVRNICRLSQTLIGARFHRDHTTILFALRRAPIHLLNPTLKATHDAVTAFFAEAKQ